jgi:Mn2+/Fe2+ NRAMP family transporter
LAPPGAWASRVLQILGPGLITGASDDDPSGIGTYSQAGAQFGFSVIWTALFTFPLMLAMQELCARIALHTGIGLGLSLRRKFPTWLVSRQNDCTRRRRSSPCCGSKK